MHCRMLSSIPGHCPLDASSTPLGGKVIIVEDRWPAPILSAGSGILLFNQAATLLHFADRSPGAQRQEITYSNGHTAVSTRVRTPTRDSAPKAWLKATILPQSQGL